jgi:hypothetical protein
VSHCILGRPGRKSTVENSTHRPIQLALAVPVSRIIEPLARMYAPAFRAWSEHGRVFA